MLDLTHGFAACAAPRSEYHGPRRGRHGLPIGDRAEAWRRAGHACNDDRVRIGALEHYVLAGSLVTSDLASTLAIVVLMSACAPRDRRATDTPSAKEPTPVAKVETALAPALTAGSAGEKWSVPATAKTDDELAAADTFDLVAVGGAALPVADTISLRDFNCAGLLTSARYILHGNRNYLWSYTRDRGNPTSPRCTGGVLREDEDGGYHLTADSIEFFSLRRWPSLRDRHRPHRPRHTRGKARVSARELRAPRARQISLVVAARSHQTNR